MTGETNRPWRLLQLSDCHLPPDPADPYRGVNADRGLAAVKSDLDEESLSEAWQEGRAMSLAELLDYALADSSA